MFLEIKNNFIQRNYSDKSKANGFFRSSSSENSKSKSPCWSRAALPRITGRCSVDVRSKHHVYRQAEDLIKHYGPARYLCNLMDSSWSPDHITIFEFVQMLGPEGMEQLNKTFLKEAQNLGILDATALMSDTTAQEAMIPYPNEVGLMKRFTDLVSKSISKVRGAAGTVKTKVKEISKKVKSLVRASQLFAKTKEQKQKVGKKLYHTTLELHDLLKNVLKNRPTSSTNL